MTTDKELREIEAMREKFEVWIVAQVGAHIKDKLEFDEIDGYPDQIINATWIGFSAGALLG